MEHEIEALGAGAAGGLSKGGHHPVTSGLPCENCGAVVPDRFCSACGQLASSFHRPVWELVTESIADMFALDGRLLRSLPMLMFRPGRMTRNYLDGKRARYVPPFRMFLLASVIFFLTVFTLNDQLGWVSGWRFDPAAQDGMNLNFTTPADQASYEELQRELADATIDAETRASLEAAVAEGPQGLPFSDLLKPDGNVDRDKLHDMIRSRAGPTATESEIAASFMAADKAATVYENQDRFGQRMRQWAPRFSILFLPVFSLLLTLMYAWKRRVYIFDHLIAGLHFQTFLYVLGTLLLLIAAFIPQSVSAVMVIGFLSIFTYLYRLLRVNYRSGRALSVLGAGILLIFGIFLLAMLAVGVVVLSFVLT